MASRISNWVHEKGNVAEKDLLALEKAQRQEKQQKKQGYRWVKITPQLQVFVPCDKDGKPTKEGERRIALLKANQRIK